MFACKDGTRKPAKTWTTWGNGEQKLIPLYPTPERTTTMYTICLAVAPCGSLIAGIADHKWARQSVLQ